VLLQLTESTLLAAAGAGLGILFAVWLKQLIVSLLFPGMPPGLEFAVPLDLRVLGLTLAISLSCGLAAGLLPAMLSRRTPVAAAIAAAGTRSATGMHWVRASVAAFQLALSLALVTGSLLLVATLRNLYSIELGFSPDNVSRHHIDPPQHGYTRDRTLAYFQDVLARLQTQPGIEAVSVSSRVPFGSSFSLRLPDPAGADKPPLRVISNAVSAGYFGVLGIGLVAGRGFTEAEAMTPPGASTSPIVISRNLATRLFGSAPPIGRTITLPGAGSSPAREVSVIGVANDVYWNSLTGERPLFAYQPLPQGSGSGSGSVLVRSAMPLQEVVRTVERLAREVDGSMPVAFSQPLIANIESEVSEQRTFAWVLSLVGWIAFTLAAVGLYGLLAQSVSERTREFGIRMAIGSGRSRIFALVLRQAFWIGLFGIVGGLSLAAIGTRLIETQLYGVTRLDPAIYLASAGVLILVILAASLWPARAATRIQPVEALRVE
jgi:predicted permease